MKRTFVKLFVSFLVGLLPINVLAAPSAPTLQKCELYFPHIASSSIWETEIGIINTGSTLLQGSLFAYSGAGTVVESRGVSISPNGKTSLLAGDDFQNSSDITYMKLEAENATCTGYEKFYREGHRAAVPAVSRVNTGNIYVSHIASGANWWTGLALVNTNPTPKNITITFSDGSQHELNLGAGAHWAGTIKGSFTDVNAEEVESAVISNARGVIGLELFGSTASINKQYLSGVLLTDETARALYYPHVASSQKWWTGIVSYNPADTSNIMTITPYTSLGSSLPTSTITIGAGGKYIGTAKALNLPEGTAWFKVEGTLPMSGFELFGTNDGKQLAGYTAVNVSSKEGVFAKLEHEGWTGIAFVNIDPSPVAVTLSAIDSSGSLVASKELSVAGNGKKVNVAQAFFADDISSADYIKFSSDRNIVGFQLNGSSDNLLLDGLEIFVETTELLLPPQLSYTIDGTYLSLSWPTVSNATGYTLSYTQPPYTGPQNFHLIDLGNQTGISYRLWDGASFYIAVQSYNDYGTSDYSNIEYFIIDNIDHGGTCHYADTDCNDCIEYTELMAYIDLWKTGEVAMSDLMEAIGLWKQGCDAEKGQMIAEYFPMGTGDEWVYKERYQENGRYHDDWVKLEVLPTEYLFNAQVTPIALSYSDNGISFDEPSSDYYTLDLNGLVAHGVDAWIDEDITSWETAIEPPLEMFPFIVAVDGNDCSTAILDYGTGFEFEFCWNVLAFDETVTVPAGTFSDTIKISTKVQDLLNGLPTGDVFEKIEWYAKGVGLIKVDALDDSDGGLPGLGDVELHNARIGGVEY